MVAALAAGLAAVVLATAPVAAAASVVAAVVLAVWAFCACSAAIRLCIKADMAWAGSWVDEVPPEEALAPALVLVLVPLLDALALPPTPSWLSAWKIEPNKPLLDEAPLVWLVLPLAEVVPVDWLSWLSQ